ncbi:MAG: transglycosylase SLT domain-containing protein [Actinomycetota bacterium]
MRGRERWVGVSGVAAAILVLTACNSAPTGRLEGVRRPSPGVSAPPAASGSSVALFPPSGVSPAPASPAVPDGRALRPESMGAAGVSPFDLARRFELADPGAVAERLRAAEAAIRSPATPATELASLGPLQQAAYRQLVAHPEWLPVVLERLPTDLRPVAEANVTAGRELRPLARPRSTLPPWRIVAPPPPEKLLGYYREAQASFGVPWEYLAAIHLVETRMGRIVGTSSAGAQGPMQFLPQTWARYGRGDINDHHAAILAAARYLVARGAPGDMARALYGYNPSQRYVRAITIYAQQMQAEARAYDAYYHWQVYYRTTQGDALLFEGWQGP